MSNFFNDFKEFYPGYYVSRGGEVARFGKTNSGYNVKHPRVLKLGLGKGYLHFTLCDGSFRKTMRVHTVVAETLLVKGSKELIVNHKDGVKTNNNLENLEWVTQKQNKKHALDMGLCKRAPRSNLSEDLVREIKKLYKPRVKSNAKELAKKYGLSEQIISNIGEGRAWKNV